MIRSSRNLKDKIKCNTPIVLSSIQHDSKCISLELPYSLACINCGPTLDPLISHRKTSKKQESNTSERHRCQQYCDSAWKKGKDTTECNIIKYHTSRRYLQIDTAVMIDYYNSYDRKRKKIDDNNDEIILNDTAKINDAE